MIAPMIWPAYPFRQPRTAVEEPRAFSPHTQAMTSWTVIACCHEEHAWWVVTPSAYFASTWPTRAEAQAEADRCNLLGLSAVSASS